jgi:hypothetical protein
MVSTFFRYGINFFLNLFLLGIIIKTFGYSHLGEYTFSNSILSMISFSQPAAALWFNRSLNLKDLNYVYVNIIQIINCIFYLVCFIFGLFILLFVGNDFELCIYVSFGIFQFFNVLTTKYFSILYTKENLIWTNLIDICRVLLPLLVVFVFYQSKLSLYYLIFFFAIGGCVYLLFIFLILRLHSYSFNLFAVRELTNINLFFQSNEKKSFFQICFGSFGSTLKDVGFFILIKPVVSNLILSDIALINRFFSLGRQGMSILQFVYLKQQINSFKITLKKQVFTRTFYLLFFYILCLALFVLFQPIIKLFFGYQNLNYYFFIFFSIIFFLEIAIFFFNITLVTSSLFDRMQRNSNILMYFYFISIAVAFILKLEIDKLLFIQFLHALLSFFLVFFTFKKYDSNSNLYI